MPGPAPKPAHLRQRTNKKSTAATLEAPENPEIPPMPPFARDWHRLTREWWEKVWSSPMASEYLSTDADGLGRLAVIVDDFHLSESSKERTELMKEIRLQEARFGLSPVDRARLHWEVAKGEEAEQRRRKPKSPQRVEDPRAVIKAVS